MTPQWSAEFEVSLELAAQLMADQFPQLAPLHIEPFGVGWDNVALRVNQQYVFRFPRRTLGAQLLESELKLMPVIAPRLPLPVSVPIFIGRATERFPWSFAGYELIAGDELCRAKFTEAQRRSLAEPLGTFLRELHSIEPEFAREQGAGLDPMRRLDVPHRAAQTREKLAYIMEHRLIDSAEPFLAIVDSTPPDYRARKDVLVHGDFYSRHVIVNEAGTLAGVIDWGDVHLGDPATDLMAAWILVPPDARATFFAAYGSIEPLAWTMARFRGLYHTCNVIPYAHQTGGDPLLSECLQALRWLKQS
jgi:aminoglycoside phosphotransferase (APT) family kinase protein